MKVLLNFIGVTLYDISLGLFRIAVILASPFNAKAKQWLTGREKWEEKLKNYNWRKGKRVWFHCASLGEFEQARPVIEKWGCAHPDDTIILTFFSPSGYEIRKNYECAEFVLYLPLDTTSNARLFIELIKPDIGLFVKYEFWFHYLAELKQRDIPVILFSSVFRKQQVFFQWYGGFFRDMLRMFTKIFVQDEGSKNLLQHISVQAEVNFDTRFDRVYEIAQSPKKFPAIEKFREGCQVFIAGSTWRKDEEMILPLIHNNVLKGYKYIIAPHDVDAGNIAALKESIPSRKKLLSEITIDNASETDVIIVDSIGQLSSLYSFGNIAYVGGAFNKSVHNVLEVAVYGLSVIFGPNYKKSVEAKELIERNAAFTFNTYQELFSLLKNLSVDNNTILNNAAIQSKKYVFEKLGGAERVVNEIKYLLESTN